MIDEKRLIECLKYDMSCFEVEGKNIAQLYVSVADMIRMIKGQPKIGDWIPCSERLPEDWQRVIVCSNGKTLEDMFTFSPSGFFFNDEQDLEIKISKGNENLIAWRSLPEPYEVNEDEQMDKIQS